LRARAIYQKHSRLSLLFSYMPLLVLLSTLSCIPSLVFFYLAPTLNHSPQGKQLHA